MPATKNRAPRASIKPHRQYARTITAAIWNAANRFAFDITYCEWEESARAITFDGKPLYRIAHNRRGYWVRVL